MTKPGTWDFGLSAEQEARAEQLHTESIIVDMVNQHPGGMNIFREYDERQLEQVFGDVGDGFFGLSQAIFAPYQLAATGQSNLIYDWWLESGITVAPRAVMMGPQDAIAPLAAYANEMEFMAELDWLRPITTTEEIRQAKKDGVIAQYGYCQPVYGLSSNIEDINGAYDQGLRMLMLTYNRQDYVGAGCTEPTNAGISMYGQQVVKRCNELGIIVDTSHCSTQTTLDACRMSETPVFANHSCAQGVYNHARGKNDEELDALAETGGVLGIVTVPFFLSGEENPTIEAVLDHIDYIAGRIGTDHIGIGTDWPMQAPEDIVEATLGGMVEEIGFREEDNISTTKTLMGFVDYRDMRNITRGLVARGYDDDQIKGILGENFMRCHAAVCD